METNTSTQNTTPQNANPLTKEPVKSSFRCAGIDANTGEALTGENIMEKTEEEIMGWKFVPVIIIEDDTRARIFNCPGLRDKCCGNLKNRMGNDRSVTLSHPCPFVQEDDEKEGAIGRAIREIKELASGFKSCISANSRP